MSYEPVMHNLIKHVVRLFYDTPQIIFIDILLKRMLIFDSEIATLLKVVPKEFNKIVFKLKEDKIIKQETKIENRENNYQEIRQAFYINYGEIKDVIKYKVYKMTKLLEVEMGKSEEIFICTTCRKEFSILDAQSLMKDFVFRCDECMGILEESRRIGENDPHNIYGILMESLKEIIGMLKEIDQMEVPFMDYFQVLDLKKKKDAYEIQQKPEIKEDIIKEETKEIKEEEEHFDIKEINTEHNKIPLKEEEVKEKKISFDNILFVNKEKKLFSEITEDDLEKMTESEYEKYFDIYNQFN
ncbi:hypothetical protein H311_02645 [Anncaliia algerae PRA109]|nr:hypothetical protein H311_02645 [Anncaliia algerae PRA109]